MRSRLKKIYLTEVVLVVKSYNLQDFKDWLKWHLDVIGFEHCHVFDNESLVDVKSVCKSYGSRVSYELVSGWANQYVLYDRYINHESLAWWVLPIDDDEFLYVSDKFNHSINDFVLDLYDNHKSLNKVSIGWRNLFPVKFTENRLDPCIVLNAVGWSDDASEVWQAGNRPVKTFVKTTAVYEWSNRIGHSTHDPLVNGKYAPGNTIDGGSVKNSWQLKPTNGDADLILYHYQFKCNKEWLYKCAKRRSPASKTFKKNFPKKYAELYNRFPIHEDCRMVDLWKELVL